MGPGHILVTTPPSPGNSKQHSHCIHQQVYASEQMKVIGAQTKQFVEKVGEDVLEWAAKMREGKVFPLPFMLSDVPLSSYAFLPAPSISLLCTLSFVPSSWWAIALDRIPFSHLRPRRRQRKHPNLPKRSPRRRIPKPKNKPAARYFVCVQWYLWREYWFQC